MSKIAPEEVDERLEDGDRSLFIMDIRYKKQYDRGHIDRSRNFPIYGDIKKGDTASLEKRLDRIPDEKEVVTVCNAGVTARKVTEYLNEKGYDAKTLKGGMRGWSQYDNNTLLYRLKKLLS